MGAPGIEVDARDVLQMFRIAPERMRAAARASLTKAGLYLEGEMKKEAPHAGGSLKATIGSQLFGEQQLEVGVMRPSRGKALVYALIQHDGGTIKGRPWLVFPPKGSPALTAAGVGGIRARDVKNNPGQLGFVSTVALPRDNPRAIIGRRADGSTELLFIVKKQVTLKGQKYIEGPFERNRQKVFDWIASDVAGAVAGDVR